MKSPPMGAPNAGEICKNYVIRPAEKSPAQTSYRQNLSIRHDGPRPRWCAGGVIRGVINNIGDIVDVG